MLAKDVRVHGLKIDKLETIITAQAVATRRMDDLDRRIDEMRHWRGFINEDVNGVYTRYGKVENIP